MWFTVFWVFCVVSTVYGSIELQPTVITELQNVFNNLSNLALMPEFMQTAGCRRDCQIYRDSFFRNEIWAIEMFDANGRPSSGILKGNVQQKGHLRECVHAVSETSKINGKFCFGKIYIKLINNNSKINEVYNKIFKNLVYLEPYKDALAPASNTILHGLCVPSSCSVSELTLASRKLLSVYNHSKFDMIIHFDNMKDQNCIVKEEYMGDTSFTRFLKNFLITMSVLVFTATLTDFFLLQDAKDDSCKRVLIVTRLFSLKQNWRLLFNVQNENIYLPWLNGARCILYFFLFAAHYTIRLHLFTVDRSEVYEQLNNPYLGCVVKNVLVVLDLLVLINGISHSYKLTKLIEQNKRTAIAKLICYRYLRFLIFVSVFLCFGFSVLHKNEALMLFTPKQKINIWSIIFCFENFAGVENMLFPPSHTFYTDMQLYVFGCAFLVLMKKRRNKFIIISASVVLILLFRSIFLYFKSDSLAFLTLGMSMDQLMNMMTYLYATPLGRLPFYIAGLALGYYSRQNIQNYEIPSFHRKIGWIGALYCLHTVAFCYYSFNYNYKYNNYDGAKVSFIHSSSAIFAVTWILWDCHLFKDSPLNKLLSAKVFVVLNRLTSYFSFLHLVVLFYTIGNQATLSQYTLVGIFGLDYMFFTVFLCIFIMLFVHLPLKNLLRLVTHTNGEEMKKD